MQHALPLRAQTLFSVGLETLRALDQLLQLDQPLGAARLGVGELVSPAPCGHELSPGATVVGAATKVLLADVSVENVELKRRPRDSALFELAGHGEQPLDKRGEILAGDGSTPGVGSGASVGEDATGGYQTLLAFGAEIRNRFETLFLEKLVR
jgi:hypothetical protein